jgi:heat shock protein HslJ
MSSILDTAGLAAMRMAFAGAFVLIAGQAAEIRAVPAGSAQNLPLAAPYWRATELAGKTVPARESAREAHLVFDSAGRVSGSDGCNRVSGTYQSKGETLTFGPARGTLMACADTAVVGEGFRAALNRARRFRIAGTRLEVFDVAGVLLGIFEGRAPSVLAPATTLQGTAWQLVRFRGGDDATLVPDDSREYTIEFGPQAGQLTARFDCNRGRGTWKSDGSSRLSFGPLALTRAKCPEGSLHDHLVKQWPFVRSYVLKDGRLFLSLQADGGIYEFEPVKKTP